MITGFHAIVYSSAVEEVRARPYNDDIMWVVI